MSPARKHAPSDSLDEIATARIELRYTDPLIWRQVELPTSITLKVLHDIIQIVMGWQDYHLWEFTIGEQRFGPPIKDDWGGEPPIDARKVRLRDLLRARETVIDYLYDFGDSWELRIAIAGIRAGEPGVSYPRYVGGEWSAPPEDCGGIPGFYQLLEAWTDPSHPDHAEISEWMEGYDPKEFEKLPIKYALSRIANRRNAAKARAAKKTGDAKSA